MSAILARFFFERRIGDKMLGPTGVTSLANAARLSLPFLGLSFAGALEPDVIEPIVYLTLCCTVQYKLLTDVSHAPGTEGL